TGPCRNSAPSGKRWQDPATVPRSFPEPIRAPTRVGERSLTEHPAKTESRGGMALPRRLAIHRCAGVREMRTITRGTELSEGNMGRPNDLTGTEQPNVVTRPLASALAVAAGLIRLIPHPWNFPPVGALGLFAGARLRAWHAFALPVALMVVTDSLLWAMKGF